MTTELKTAMANRVFNFSMTSLRSLWLNIPENRAFRMGY